MSELMIGTRDGAFRLAGPSVAREEGPPSVSFLAAAKRSTYALTPEAGLWVRTNREPWRPLNPRCVEEQVWSFAADPRAEGRLYLGVSPALLYRSDDGGKSWGACDSMRRIPGYERWTFPPPPHIPHVRWIAPDPSLERGIYIGVEEGGVYRSPDGGHTWESLNDGLYWDVHTVTPLGRGARLYATTGNGFYRSDDGGRSWRSRMDGLDRSYTVACATAEERPERVYVAAAATPPPGWANGADAALYRSDDSGEHWTRLFQGLPERFDSMIRAVALDGGAVVYALTGAELHASRDGGESWTLAARELPGARTLAIVEPSRS